MEKDKLILKRDSVNRTVQGS